MGDFSINPTDVGVIAILLISGVLALSRGFVREVLAISSWIGAAVATYYAFPLLKEPSRVYFKKWFAMDQTLFADIATGTAVFLVVLIVLVLIAAWISKKVQSSDIGALDRSLGFLFGLIRGALVVALAYLLLVQFIPIKDHPKWVSEARALPALSWGAHFLIRLTPKKIAKGLEKLPEKTDKLIKDAKKSGDPAKAVKDALMDDDKNGYDKDQKKDLDRLIDNSNEDESGDKKPAGEK